MYQSKTKNFSKHYITAVYKTCLDIVEFNSISNAKQNTKKMLQDIAQDSNAPADYFDKLIDEYAITIEAEAKDIVEFYYDCSRNTLLKINKRQRKEDYINQVGKIYKAVADYLNNENVRFNEDFEIVLGLLHYELHVKSLFS